MTLSRHFYALDEVQAALQYATTRNDRSETLFWCYELLSSGCAGEAISTLFESWLWYKGPFALSWLTTAHPMIDERVVEGDILLAAYQLSWIPYTRRDHSLWNILVLYAAGTPPDRVTPKTPPYLPSNDENEVFMVRAMFQGKAYSAWWMSRHLSDARVWELLRWYVIYNCPLHSEAYLSCLSLLEHYEDLLGYRSEEYTIAIRCAAVLSVCLNPAQQEQSFQPLPSAIDARLQVTLDEWDTEAGQKAHRRYTIPTACLYGRTARGQMKWSESTVPQLGRLESCLASCPFWAYALEEYGQEGSWNSDNDRDAFYDRYFTDDVPDEWTKVEKQKSHGDGIMGPKDTITAAGYARRFFTGCSRLAWTKAGEFLNGKEGTWLEIVLHSPPDRVIPLKPVHRRVCI